MCSTYEDYIVITNRKLCKTDFTEKILEIVLKKPCALILREKDLDKEEYSRLAHKVYEICMANDVRFFVHSYPDVASAIGCKNIHLSMQGMRDNMNHLGLFDNISVSCHSEEDVREAVRAGATQIVLGTIFETECKKGKKGSGLSFVKQITDMCSLPVYAIGGIKPDNIEAVKAAGAKGGCMMSWFMGEMV